MENFDMEKYEKITKYTVNRQWGIYIWGTIHEVAMGFPEIPNEADREHYTQFYTLLFDGRIDITRFYKSYKNTFK